MNLFAGLVIVESTSKDLQYEVLGRIQYFCQETLIFSILLNIEKTLLGEVMVIGFAVG